MEMLEVQTPTRRIDYKDWVIYQDKEYVRSETLSIKHYSWQSSPDELIDLHTISWEEKDGEELIQYYSGDMGWSKDGHLHKDNPVPDIELVFKRTIGKDLIYI